MVAIFASALAFIVDRLTKNNCERRLANEEEIRYFNKWVSFRLSKNPGIFLSKLEKRPELVKILHGLAMVIVLIIILPTAMRKDALLVHKFGVGFFLGGGLGNLYDRIKEGAVTDFFSFKCLPKVIFNVADLFVMAGALLILIGELFKK